jgi:hypothetical protein
MTVMSVFAAASLIFMTGLSVWAAVTLATETVSPGSERKGGEAGATANQRSDAKPANVVNVS